MLPHAQQTTDSAAPTLTPADRRRQQRQAANKRKVEITIASMK